MSPAATIAVAIMAKAPRAAAVTARERAVGIGEVVPDVPLQTFDGQPQPLASLRGHPLLVVCVRYYG